MHDFVEIAQQSVRYPPERRFMIISSSYCRKTSLPVPEYAIFALPGILFLPKIVEWIRSRRRRRLALVIADNGPGFQDSPEYLIEPFITRKPDGMGLGLHIADQVMKTQGGKLEFPQRGDVALPKRFSGAVVALVFGGAKWLD